MMHPYLRKGILTMMIVSGGIFSVLSALTVIGVALITLNGGSV